MTSGGQLTLSVTANIFYLQFEIRHKTRNAPLDAENIDVVNQEHNVCRNKHIYQVVQTPHHQVGLIGQAITSMIGTTGHHGMHNRMYHGIHNRIHNGMHNEMHNEMYHGMHNQMHNEMHNEMHNKMHHGMYHGMHHRMYHGMYRGMHNGIHHGMYHGMYSANSCHSQVPLTSVALPLATSIANINLGTSLAVFIAWVRNECY